MNRLNSFTRINLESASTSKGNQQKWFDGKYWYKSNFMGYENVAEVVVSILCSCIQNLDYVKYDLYEQDYCVSKDFLGDNEFISFNKILRSFGVSSSKFNKLAPVRRLQSIMNLYSLVPKDKILEYLNKIFYLDALVLNEDRHLNNLGFIKTPNGEFGICPVFDNGLSLLSDIRDYPFRVNLIDNILSVKSKPLSNDFEVQIRLIKNYYDCKPLIIDINNFYKSIDNYDFSNYEKELERCLDVLDYTFNKWEGDLWIQK